MKSFSLIAVILSMIALVYFYALSGIHELEEKDSRSQIYESLDQKVFGKSNDEPNIFDLRRTSKQSYLTDKNRMDVPHSEKVYLFDARQQFTKDHLAGSDRFRFVSYNILADCYAHLKYFPYCPESALNIKYRLPLLHKEIQGYHGDVVCLQEVDEFVFSDHLKPEMSKLSYGSGFAQKQGKKDGTAMFYNQQKFKLVSAREVVLRQSLEEDDENISLRKFAFHNPAFKNRVMKYGTCALLSVLQSAEDPTRYLVVATTHLYYHSSASHVRLIQMAVILNLVQSTVANLQLTQSKGSTVSYVICGDLNSDPSSGLVEFMLSGKLHSNHSDWYSGGPTEYHSTSQSLSHSLKLISACGFPKYTGYVGHVNHCLDYIFVGLHINVDKVLEAPPHELVTKYTALPSIIGPSDHIAQVVDLSWTTLLNLAVSL